MSYPDEWEAEIEGMIADLDEAGALPPSIVELNRAAIAEIVNGSLTQRRFVADAIFGKSS